MTSRQRQGSWLQRSQQVTLIPMAESRLSLEVGSRVVVPKLSVMGVTLLSTTRPFSSVLANVFHVLIRAVLLRDLGDKRLKPAERRFELLLALE